MKTKGIFGKPVTTGDDVEWLETNGAGAFCSSSISDCPSRKYHGLLVTPLPGHEGRFHILSAVEARLRSMPEFTIGSSRYRGTIHPASFEYIDEAALLPWPRWTCSCGGTRISKEVFMRGGRRAVYVAYTLEEGEGPAVLDLKFLFTFRGSHELTSENHDINSEIEIGSTICITPYYSLPPAVISFSGDWSQKGGVYWDRDVEYTEERGRGFDHHEDRFVPGSISITLEKGKPFIIEISSGENSASRPSELRKIRSEEFEKRSGEDGVIESDRQLLCRNAGHFLLCTPEGGRSVNAGYPWFGEWGRDTMIALPGLSCYNGDPDYCAGVLSDYAALIKNGMLPNTIGATQGFTSYNSMDAGLLFCRTVRLLQETGWGRRGRAKDLLYAEIYPAVLEIVKAFLDGRVPETRLTGDGLIWCGSPDTQLTWMDAKVRGRPVTPRWGLAVELNALWYEALVLCLSFHGDEDGRIGRLTEKLPAAFRAAFWLGEEGYLSDTVNENGPDGKLRPNMLFAAAAPPGLLTEAQRAAVAEAAENKLLTPMGLRTLSPDDPCFEAWYDGGPEERDSRYHQGTVWPWLLGIMVEASLGAATDKAEKALFWRDYMENLLEKHLEHQGWGFISEVFDGLEPVRGKGCFAQAWSSGEIIRALYLIDKVLSESS